MVEHAGDLLVVDPALNSPGAALFRGGVLTAAEKVRIDPDYAKLPIGERVGRVAADVVRWVIARNAAPRYLAVEWPQIYQRTHQKGAKRGADNNDLLGLAGVCGAVVGILQLGMARRDVALTVVSPTPGEWAGQLPKATTGDAKSSPRALRILSRLSPAERNCVPASHDAIDAVGLGLFCLGRFERRRVMPGVLPIRPDLDDAAAD